MSRILTTFRLMASLMVAMVPREQLNRTPPPPSDDTPPPPLQPEMLKPGPVSGATISTSPRAIAVTLIGPRPYSFGTVTMSPTATLISHVPSAHGPVGEGDGVAVSVEAGVGSDAGDPEPDLRGWSSAGNTFEESEEHDVRAANTTATATATDDLLRIMVTMQPRRNR